MGALDWTIFWPLTLLIGESPILHSDRAALFSLLRGLKILPSLWPEEPSQSLG